METFTISLLQMQVGPDRDANLERAGALIERAVEGGAALVVLPEMFNCPYELECFPAYAEPLTEGPTGRFLAGIARRLGTHLVGGSIPERRDGEIYNTATLWSPAGELLLVHRKVHLFDVDIPGGITFKESVALAAGDEIGTAETALGRIGLGICYDLRFPELFRVMALAGAELIVLPGAFNTTTGPAHWESLVRSRAIENTCYLAACASAPHPEGTYPGWGHSMVVDPYGRILAQAEREEATVTATVDGRRLTEVRQALPVLVQRRPDVYRRATTNGGL